MDSIKDIIPRVIEKMARERGQHVGERDTLEQAWQDILGKQDSRHTRLRGYRNGDLLVLVNSPARLYHLRMRKAKILKQLHEKIPAIKNITFKVGTDQ